MDDSQARRVTTAEAGQDTFFLKLNGFTFQNTKIHTCK